jgi:hypothetical protein
VESTTVELERFQPMYGWANRLLRVNLSTMTSGGQILCLAVKEAGCGSMSIGKI